MRPRICKVDSDLGLKTKTAINSFLLQQSVKDFDAWSGDRRLVAAIGTVAGGLAITGFWFAVRLEELLWLLLGLPAVALMMHFGRALERGEKARPVAWYPGRQRVSLCGLVRDVFGICVPFRPFRSPCVLRFACRPF